jgi:hypothetical protein
MQKVIRKCLSRNEKDIARNSWLPEFGVPMGWVQRERHLNPQLDEDFPIISGVPNDFTRTWLHSTYLPDIILPRYTADFPQHSPRAA